MKRRLGPSSHTPLTIDQRFIEALREVLGLGYLYGDPLSRGRGHRDEARDLGRFGHPQGAPWEQRR